MRLNVHQSNYQIKLIDKSKPNIEIYDDVIVLKFLYFFNSEVRVYFYNFNSEIIHEFKIIHGSKCFLHQFKYFQFSSVSDTV